MLRFTTRRQIIKLPLCGKAGIIYIVNQVKIELVFNLSFEVRLE